LHCAGLKKLLSIPPHLSAPGPRLAVGDVERGSIQYSLPDFRSSIMMPMRYRVRAWWIGALGLLGAVGCATTPYQYGQFHLTRPDGDAPASVVIEHGKPHKTLDRIAWVAGMPGRILPLNSKINRHDISPETAETLKTYLEKNDLADVYVYVNHYDPTGQWQRLRENKLISPVWRYSFGVLSFAGYTMMPNRVFGGDKYNPYTNSLYVNSDVPAIALDQAAFAKDIHSRKFPGTYAAINDLPVLSVWHEARAIGDVLGYARAENDWEIERQTYRVVYPRLGAASAGFAGPLVSTMVAGPITPMLVGPAMHLSGAAVGHVAGRTLAARRDAERHNANLMEDPKKFDVQQASYVEHESLRSGDQSPEAEPDALEPGPQTPLTTRLPPP
jgi:hypothetical protein